jgi:hypothetical protein
VGLSPRPNCKPYLSLILLNYRMPSIQTLPSTTQACHQMILLVLVSHHIKPKSLLICARVATMPFLDAYWTTEAHTRPGIRSCRRGFSFNVKGTQIYWSSGHNYISFKDHYNPSLSSNDATSIKLKSLLIRARVATIPFLDANMLVLDD